MYLTPNELNALVQHLRAQHPQDEALRSVLRKAGEELRTRRAPRKANDLDHASALARKAAEAGVPVNVYLNPGVAAGAKKPTPARELLKPGARLDANKSAEELLFELGLD